MVHSNILNEFVGYITSKQEIETIIVDGSIANNEYIDGYSDIDIKIFIRDLKINFDTFKNINEAIQILQNQNVNTLMNVWTIPFSDFPFIYLGNQWDFVRRFCLKSGFLIYGENYLEKVWLIDKLTLMEKDTCIKSISTFLIRLRRLLTNGNVITDINELSSKLLFQQAIAYYFHSIRYFNAFYGNVIASVENNFKMFISNVNVSQESKIFSYKMFNHRLDYMALDFSNLNSSYEFLFQTTTEITNLCNNIKMNINADEKKIIYL